MTKDELDKLVDRAVLRIFEKRNDAINFCHVAVLHWRHTPENILAIHIQDRDATCIAGRKAFEALGYTYKAKEKPIYIYNTIVQRSGEEGRYTSEFIPVQAYDIRQFDGVRTERENKEHIHEIDIVKLCSESGVIIIEADNLPGTDSCYGVYYDEDEHTIVLLNGLRGDSRISALIYAYAKAAILKYMKEDRVTGVLSENNGIYVDNVAALTAFCIEIFCGIKTAATKPESIVSNVAAAYPNHEDQKRFLSNVCLMVQRIIKTIEGDMLTVEEINILNSLMTSDEAGILKEMLERIEGQTGIDRRVKLSACRVLKRLLEDCSDDKLSAIYDARIHKSLYTYPAFRINTQFKAGSKGERSESKRNL